MVMVNVNSSSYADGYKDGFAGKRDMSESYAVFGSFQSGSNYAAGYRKGEQDAEVDDTFDGQPDEAQEWADFDPDC